MIASDPEIERCRTLMLDPAAVFVFGSNLAGIHGAGAARTAYVLHGAMMGVGEGRTGRSYAIPTKEANVSDARPLTDIAASVRVFIGHARACPKLRFVVTRIGCGYAGYSDADIAPMFKGAPENCFLPTGWREEP